MSISESGKPVSEIPVPGVDLNYPELDKQPWYLAAGDSLAGKFANALIENGTWLAPRSTSDPTLVPYTWQGPLPGPSDDGGVGLLVNRNPPDESVDPPKNESNYAAYFLWNIKDNGPSGKDGKVRAVYYQKSSGKWSDNASPQLDANQKYWFWVLDAPGDAAVPGPLPLLGAGAAFGWTRRLRQRIRQHG